ncbi:MAG: mechanosensitive ion channel [Acidobacteria bacterium]|jgi:small-conductance mechanosensitive channel|nr:mechanosensitive ion channel [Acidobacteriota bacterium]
MNWFLLIPVSSLALIVFLYLIIKKAGAPRKLKSIIPYLFGLFLVSIALMSLKSDMIKGIFHADILIFIFQLIIYFLLLIIIVKFITIIIFDAYLEPDKYPRMIKDIVVITLYVVGLLFIARYYLQLKVAEVLASAAVLTVVVGFALQDILRDLFSGIAVNLEESLKLGDWVSIGPYEGRIEQFRWRSIKIRTTDNVLVVIPNQVASKEAVKNFSHAGQYFALRSQIGVSYKNSPDLVLKTFENVLDSIDLILKEPGPEVKIIRFDDFSIVYEMKYYFKDFSKKYFIQGEINRKSWYAFKRTGIEIPFPIRDVYLKKPPEEEVTCQALIDILKNHEVLKTIDEKQLQNLVKGVDIKVYGKGETVITEGEIGHYFYHILMGEVEIVKNNKVMQTLGSNDYFGEFSLFTGEMTTADVRAAKECTFLRISSEKFHETVKMNLDMARKLSEVIAARRAKQKEFSEKEAANMPSIIRTDSENIFLRIKKYFSF